MDTWEQIRAIDRTWGINFLERLESDPKLDPESTAVSIGTQLGEIYPYVDQATGDAYRSVVPYGALAEKKFRTVLFMLGDTVDPAAVAESIIREGSAADRYPPGIYGVGERRLRILPSSEVVLYTDEHGNPLQDQQFFSGMSAMRASLPASEASLRLVVLDD